MLNYQTLPNPKMIPIFAGYFEHGWYPGDFVGALLRNDLREAAQHADWINQDFLFEYAAWLHWEAPANSWGSHEKVKTWMDNHALTITKQTGTQ